jgi:hypothetical protein
MEAFVKPLEQMLLPLFKSLPSLPENAKKTFVNIWPWLALVFGVLQLFAVVGLWNLGHTVNTLVNIYAAAGIAAPNNLGLFYYLGLGSLAIDAVLLLLAVAPLNAHKKSGWDLLFLGALLNLAYGVVIVFDSYYGGFGNLLGALIGSAIAFYFLFQVRDYYTGTKTVATGSTTPKV